jgi:hypothetical protein
MRARNNPAARASAAAPTHKRRLIMKCCILGYRNPRARPSKRPDKSSREEDGGGQGWTNQEIHGIHGKRGLISANSRGGFVTGLGLHAARPFAAFRTPSHRRLRRLRESFMQICHLPCAICNIRLWLCRAVYFVVSTSRIRPNPVAEPGAPGTYCRRSAEPKQGLGRSISRRMSLERF